MKVLLGWTHYNCLLAETELSKCSLQAIPVPICGMVWWRSGPLQLSGPNPSPGGSSRGIRGLQGQQQSLQNVKKEVSVNLGIIGHPNGDARFY